MERAETPGLVSPSLGSGQRRAFGATLLQWRPVSIGHAATNPFDYEMFGKEEGTTMTHVDAQTVQCHLGRYLLADVTDASENIRPERRHFTQGVKLPWPERSRQTPGPGNKQGKKGVCTMCTPWASDWVVPVPDGAGFRMFRRESSVCKGRNAVRFPPRAQCFRRSGAFLVLFSCAHCAHSRL